MVCKLGYEFALFLFGYSSLKMFVKADNPELTSWAMHFGVTRPILLDYN